MKPAGSVVTRRKDRARGREPRLAWREEDDVAGDRRKKGGKKPRGKKAGERINFVIKRNDRGSRILVEWKRDGWIEDSARKKRRREGDPEMDAFERTGPRERGPREEDRGGEAPSARDNWGHRGPVGLASYESVPSLLSHGYETENLGLGVYTRVYTYA